MTPDEYKKLRQAAYEQLAIGKTYTFRRTFTDGDVSLFCGVTGDYNPYHIDDTFVAATKIQRRIIPGLLTASMSTHIGGLLGMLASEMHFNFVAPVYIGDTVMCTVTIVEKYSENRTVRGEIVCVNQEGVTVLTGYWVGFPSVMRLR